MTESEPVGPASGSLVVLAGDDGFARPMTVAVASLVATTPGPIELLVVDAGLSDANRGAVVEAARPWPVRVERFPAEWLDEVPAAGTTRLPPTAYARLFSTRLAGPDCRRILYLDGDVLIRESLQPLLDLDLEGNTIAAVGAERVTHFARPSASVNLPGWREAGIPASAMVFNSGVMVIDRHDWDARQVTARTLAAANAMAGRTTWADQASLNIVLWDRWLPLDRRWNCRTPDAAIAHFAGPFKPWSGPALPSALYVEYLERAAEQGWVIPGRRRLRMRRWLRQGADAAVPPVLLRRGRPRPGSSAQG
jgi:lipopolysaccharide biosynthesis glycosyltransferase